MISTPLHHPLRKRRSVTARRGTTVVEFAMVLPVLFLIMVGALEFGRAYFVLHVLKEGARQGARVAVVGGTKSEDVRAAAAQVLDAAGVSNYRLTITPEILDLADQWDPVTVSLTTEFRDVSWLPVPQFLGNRQLKGSSTLPREAERPQ